MSNIRRQKVTVPPPTLCDPPCYHAARSRTLEKLVKKVRLEMIKMSHEKLKLEAALKKKMSKAAEAEAPAEVATDRDVEGKDLEVVDLVTQFQKRGIE